MKPDLIALFDRCYDAILARPGIRRGAASPGKLVPKKVLQTLTGAPARLIADVRWLTGPRVTWAVTISNHYCPVNNRTNSIGYRP